MSQWWVGLDALTKIIFIIVIVSLVILAVRVLIYFLKFSDRESEYLPPKYLSFGNGLSWIALYGIFYMIFHKLNIGTVKSLILGFACGLVLISLNWLISRKLAYRIRKEVVMPYSELVSCTGKVLKQVSRAGGSVFLGYKDRFVCVRAVSDQVIKKGKKIRVVNYTDVGVVCVPVNDY